MKTMLTALAALCLGGCGAASQTDADHRVPLRGTPPAVVAMTCRPVGDVHYAGSPVSAIVELTNESGGEISILGSSVPWQFHHAMRFAASGYEDPRVLADPAEYPALMLAAGASDRGDVDLGGRLVDASGRSFAETAGSYDVSASALLVLDPGTASQRDVDASCRFAVTIEPRTASYDAALEAATAGGVDLAQFRLVSLEERDGESMFLFEHVYPAPPGGHFMVRVDTSGTATLAPGE